MLALVVLVAFVACEAVLGATGAAPSAHSVWLCPAPAALSGAPAHTVYGLPGLPSVVVLAEPAVLPAALQCVASPHAAGETHFLLRGGAAAVGRLSGVAGVRAVPVGGSAEAVLAVFDEARLGSISEQLYELEVEAVTHIQPAQRRGAAEGTRLPLRLGGGGSSAGAAKRASSPAKQAVVASVGQGGPELTLQLEYLSGVKSFRLADGRNVTTPTRFTNTAANRNSAQMIREYFQQYYADVRFQNFTYGGQVTRNIIAVKPGRTAEVVVVGAHMDSISSSPQTLAPGVVDNGSGTAGVMLLAKAFADVQTERTIHFVAFNAEEQGLYGSQYYVNSLAANGFDVRFSLIMDMIGYSAAYYGVKLEGTPDAATMELMDLAENNTIEFAPSLQILKAYYSFGSDHVPFQQAGIPCFLYIELDETTYPGYHSTTDQMSYLSVPQSIDILKGLAGALWDLTVVEATSTPSPRPGNPTATHIRTSDTPIPTASESDVVNGASTVAGHGLWLAVVLSLAVARLAAL